MAIFRKSLFILTISLPLLASASAQESTSITSVPKSAAIADTDGTAIPALVPNPTPTAAQAPLAAPACELHIWPTLSYTGVNTGLLSGFGVIGAIADNASHKNRVTTVKDLMAEYLPPEVQIAELEKVGLLETLNLKDYQIILHEPTPSAEAVKADEALNAATKAFNAKLKSNQRLTDSTASCYSEFILTDIFYHKAMMYGSNLFVSMTFRDFNNPNAVRRSFGAVKNPLEHFPPKTPETADTAKAELLKAFAQDFVEWSQKKLLK